MKDNLNTHRVITFLTREELDFIDKIEKDIMFSTGRRISRSQILQDAAELLARTHMNAKGIKDNDTLIHKMQQEIANINKTNPESQNGQNGHIQ